MHQIRLDILMKIKKERFTVDVSLGWKLIYLSIFVLGGVGYAFYSVYSSPSPTTAALAHVEPVKIAFELYLIAIMGVMCYIFMIGVYMIVETEKDNKKSDST